MIPFSALTHRGQMARLRRLAESVLPEYHLINPRLTVITRGYNMTFCIHAEGGATDARNDGYAANRYLLRVHRSGWQGTESQTRSIVESEMIWLSALLEDTDLVVPEPQQTKEAVYTAVGSDDGVPDSRVCSVLRWLNGRRYAQSPKPVHLQRVGALTAQLHNHAAGWTVPAGFVRPDWHWDALFGNAISYTHLSAPDIWGIVPSAYRGAFEKAALALRQAMVELWTSQEVWGLIHADLHLDNVFFAHGEARPIDFDDSGYGYWLYDIAVALWELRLHNDWPAFREAFLEGYAQHRPVPYDQLPYLDIFIAGREAMIGLVNAAATKETPAYLEYLDEDMRHIAETIQAIQTWRGC